MMSKSIGDFLQSVHDFDNFSEKNQVDYLAYYLQTEKEAVCFYASEIEEVYREIPAKPYRRLSQYLSEEANKKSKDVKYVKAQYAGYVLSRRRFDEIKTSITISPRKIEVSATLRELKGSLSNQAEQSFLDETIKCHDFEANRAAIVMMWSLVVAHLRNFVLLEKLTEFNDSIKLWNSGHPKNSYNYITDYEDFADIPESKLIELLKIGKIITKQQRELLDEKLKTRNAAGHPTTIKISPHTATEFIAALAANILL